MLIMCAKFRENQRKTVGVGIWKKSLTSHRHPSINHLHYKLRWLQSRAELNSTGWHAAGDESLELMKLIRKKWRRPRVPRRPLSGRFFDWRNMSVHQWNVTDRRYDGEVPGPVDVSVRAVDVVMLDPLDVWLEITEDDTTERDGVADVRRLVVRRLRDDRRVRQHSCENKHNAISI